MSSKISNHFKPLKRKRTGAESTVNEVLEIESDEESGSAKIADDPKEIYKMVASGQVRGVYKPLEEIETTKDLSAIFNNEKVSFVL